MPVSPQEKKHIHEVAGSKSYVKAGYINFLELPRPAQILLGVVCFKLK